MDFMPDIAQDRLAFERAVECGICLEGYGKNYRYPQVLNCGHSICQPCGNRRTVDGSINCPICKVTAPNQENKNYNLFDLLLSLGLLQDDEEPPQEPPVAGQNDVIGMLDADGDEWFFIDGIIDHRFRNGELEFCIVWTNSDETTWEPATCLNADEAIEEYMASLD